MTEQRLTDERIDAVILEELRKYGDVGARRALTYDSGPYEITKVTQLGRSIGRAIETAILSADRGEPVAWLEVHDDGEVMGVTLQKPEPWPNRTYKPLYAAAPSTPQPDTVQVPREGA